jgi:Phosphodiester glycosidase
MFIRKLMSWPRRGRIVVLVGVGLLVLALASGCAAITVVPAAGAQAADWLRGIIGDEAVAQVENVVYQVQDSVQQVAYALGVGRPSSPWQGTPVAEAPTDTAPQEPTDTPPTLSPQASPTDSGAPTATPSTPTTPSTPIATQPATTETPVAPAAWTLPPLKPMGTLANEGQWLPYLQNPAGQVVAYRTFLQPDQQRRYAVVAIVAFNLSATHLHFVLGSLEPTSDVAIPRPGTIAAEDLQAGKLLATFNGGFKERHGHFGVMVNGTTVIPPRDGMGTVAFYDDGHITLGQWDTNILSSTHVVTWRQNGPLVIQDGQINPHTADTAPQDWGYTVPGSTAIWRSGLGISADGATLYYIAGPSLTLPVLAMTMQDAGMQQAMQLDINNFWVHFDAIQGAKVRATPLLDGMNNKVGRYLSAYPRDFFYVTANGP